MKKLKKLREQLRALDKKKNRVLQRSLMIKITKLKDELESEYDYSKDPF
mgnify:CR=1 FL=1